METKYSTLRKPKRKLCYNYASKERPPNQWIGDDPLSLGDIDKIFDDLDPSGSNEPIDLLPSTSLLRVSDAMLNESEGGTGASPQQERHRTEKKSRCEKGPNEDVLNTAMRSPSPEADSDLDSAFSAHGPVKTSSPIEENLIAKGQEELGVEKHRVMSPILFACEDEGKEEAGMDPLPTPKSQCQGQITKQDDDSELESPPSKVVLSKPKMSSQRNEVEGSCKESHPVKEKATQKMTTTDLKGKRKAPRQENTEPPMTAVRQEPGVATPGKNSEGVHRPPPMKASAFLQKLRDAAHPKPSCSRKSLSPVKVPSPPEPEDDFLILEDDTPLFISIPSNSATNKRRGKASSSADREAKDAPLESAQKQQESEQANVKVGGQNVDRKMKTKEKGKNEATGPGYEIEEFGSEELPAGDVVEREKLSRKKQRLKRVPSKQSDKAEDQPEVSARGQTDKETNRQTSEKKAQASSDAKRSKSSKDRSENGKTRKAKSSKGARKVTQESGAVMEAVCVEPVERLREQSSAEQADAEDPGSLSDKESRNSEAQTDEQTKQTKQRLVSEGSSSEDCQIVGKRKRRQPGQWWLSGSQVSEETEATDKRLTPKKSKPSDKESGAAIRSSVKTEKGKGKGASKRRNQRPPAPSSGQRTTKAKGKKTNQNKARKTPRGRRDKMKADVSDAVEAEQEIPDQDQDPDHKDQSYNSGDQVYHPVVNEILPGTPARDPSGSGERRREEVPQKRRKRPVSNWWEVNGVSEDGQGVPPQTQRQEPNPPRKARKKRAERSASSGLGAPKNGNVAVSVKPAGGSAAPLLKVNPFPAPAAVKRRSLAAFIDLFPSVAETGAAVRRRGAGPSGGHEVTVTDCTTHGETREDVLSADAGGSSSPLHAEAPQNSECQSDNMLISLQSGPSSMIELEQHEDNDYSVLPSTRVSAVLSASDLCAPPLAPLVLQPKDKANLTEWLKYLWSTSAGDGPEITPDHFDWYFHRGRAIGLLVDLNSGLICNGKMLLGSYMKKPLWVDHSGTTVFNILTSSVSVVIDGCESRCNPGQSFMVPCGHAYSIQNILSQPAALYFTRVYVESSD